MIKPIIMTNKPIFQLFADLSYREPVKFIKNLLGGTAGFFVAEHFERRGISPKIKEIERYYAIEWTLRREKSIRSLVDTLEFCSVNVPYYKDIFSKNNVIPQKLLRDIKYFWDVPILTKDIIREQGERLLSSNLNEVRHYKCKTGGSTGQSCCIYYDQTSADYASAVVIYGRKSVGRSLYKSELHFACRFPDDEPRRWPDREDFKCFAMNRSNIFFDRIDNQGLEEIWLTLKKRRPYLVHGHPSTLYALANFVKMKYGSDSAFSIFESSGELLEDYMKNKIETTLQCKTVNRYGLAEMGVVAYELFGHENGLRILDSECWIENSLDKGLNKEIIMTSYRNRLMPLVRYASGDLGDVIETCNGRFVHNMTGRIHDIVLINGVEYATHYVQDILDHRVGGIQEFQVDARKGKPVLRIVPEPYADSQELFIKLTNIWGNGFDVEFIGQEQLVRVGDRAKFRHVITA